MPTPGLSWLTPLEGSLPKKATRGRPRKLNSAVTAWIDEMRGTHTIAEMAHILKLNRDTVSEYLNRPKRGR